MRRGSLLLVVSVLAGSVTSEQLHARQTPLWLPSSTALINATSQFLGWGISGVVADPDKLQEIAARIRPENNTNSSSLIDMAIVKETIRLGSILSNSSNPPTFAVRNHLVDAYTAMFSEAYLALMPQDASTLYIWAMCTYMSSPTAFNTQRVNYTMMWTRTCDYLRGPVLGADEPFTASWPGLLTARSELLGALWMQNLADVIDRQQMCKSFSNSGSHGPRAIDVGFYQGPLRRALCDGYTPKPAPKPEEARLAVKKWSTLHLVEQIIGVTNDLGWIGVFCRDTPSKAFTSLGFDTDLWHKNICAAESFMS